MATDTLEEKVAKLISDAELAVLQGRCRLDPDAYGKVVEMEQCCCLVGAAGLTSGMTFAEVCEMGASPEAQDKGLELLGARYGLSEEAFDGIEDGFDNVHPLVRPLDTANSDAYRTAYAMARAAAVRFRIKGTEEEWDVKERATDAV